MSWCTLCRNWIILKREQWMMLEVIDFMNEETHRRQIVTPKHNITEKYSLNWLSYCAPVYLQISFNCKDILNFRLWSNVRPRLSFTILSRPAALARLRSLLNPLWAMSRTFENIWCWINTGERENGVSQNNTHHNDNTKALIKILSSVLSTATTKQGEEHNQEQFKIRMLSVI